MAATKRLRTKLGLAGIALLAAAGLLAACGDDKPDPKIPPTNSSEAFKDGYAKGCPTGLESANKPSPNWAGSLVDPRYNQDPEYKRGWDQGYFTCYDSEFGGSTTSTFSFSLSDIYPF